MGISINEFSTNKKVYKKKVGREDILYKLFEIRQTKLGRLGVFEIYLFDKFHEKSEEKKEICVQKIEEEFKDFQKEKGNCLVIITYGRDRKEIAYKMLKRKLGLLEQRPKQGILSELCQRQMGFQSTTSKFLFAMKNMEMYQNDVMIYENINTAIRECKGNGYEIYGWWREGEYDFYYFRKNRRRLYLYLEDGKYYLNINEKDHLLKNGTVDEIRKICVTELENIRKKERLKVIVEGEEASLLFHWCNSFYNLIEKSSVEKIWEELRKVYSYEEMEREAIRKLENKEKNEENDINGIHFLKFAEYYVAVRIEQEEVFVSKDKKELMKKLTSLYEKEWTDYMIKLEKDLT